MPAGMFYVFLVVDAMILRALNVNILDRKKPKRDLKIIPFNPASIFTDTVTAPGTSESEDSQTLRASTSSDSVTLSWHPQPPGQIRKRSYRRKQEFLSLERGYKHYVPATSTSTPPQAHPPLTPPSPPPNPAPPSPAPPNPAPSSHTPPPPGTYLITPGQANRFDGAIDYRTRDCVGLGSATSMLRMV